MSTINYTTAHGWVTVAKSDNESLPWPLGIDSAAFPTESTQGKILLNEPVEADALKILLVTEKARGSAAQTKINKYEAERFEVAKMLASEHDLDNEELEALGLPLVDRQYTLTATVTVMKTVRINDFESSEDPTSDAFMEEAVSQLLDPGYWDSEEDDEVDIDHESVDAQLI